MTRITLTKYVATALSLAMLATLPACGSETGSSAEQEGIAPSRSESIISTTSNSKDGSNMSEAYGANTKISDVIGDPAFGDYGRLIFPAHTGYYSGNTLGELSLTWYTGIVPEKTVEIANYMKSQAVSGETIFYDIYTDEEKAADPAKKDTGLFFFKGNPGEKFAVCNAGGGFAFVGAMHDSFPHALELSKKGYNAFALIYRPGAQTACEDLARAISFIFEHADELGVSTSDYSLWGGSAGARMVANLGSYGPVAFGEDDLPRPGTVIMQYTGHSDYTQNDPPTFAVIGDRDGIASPSTMESRVNALKSLGIDAEYHLYKNLGHGFGLGTGTSAEGWFDDAVRFWEKHINASTSNVQGKEIKLMVGDTVITAELDDSEIARQFAAILPQTITMSRGRDREYYGRIDGTLQYGEADIQTIAEDGDFAYWFSGNSLAFFFNTENDSAVNSGIVVFGKITSDLSVFDGMSGSETMTVTLSD